MKEKISLEFERYRDKDNNPTCACSFEASNFEVCKFYRTQNFGTHESCIFAPEGYKGIMQRLDRREPNKLGTLIPGDWCPLWKK
jgi:hypothetical protein